MPVLGAYDGDISRALGGDPGAIDRVTFGFYVWPHFLKWLERVKLLRETDPRNLIPVPPEPLSHADLGALLLRPLYGEPEPEVSMVAARVRMLEQALGGLGDLEQLLAAELDRVKSFADLER